MNKQERIAKIEKQRALLGQALAKVASFDKKYVAGRWEVSGPCKVGTINIITGEVSKMRYSGYGIRATEPVIFGGTVVINDGLTKAFAERVVAQHNIKV